MATCISCLGVTLILLVSANGAPILADKLLRGGCKWPVDGELKLGDGHPLFGNTKTWLGLLSAVFLTSVIARLLSLPASLGAIFALWSMAGDLFASFCKRRLGKTESSRARGLDTLPESLLPTWMLKDDLALHNPDILLIVMAFFLMEEFGSPLLYKWHIRGRPY